ncbi:hypothetical protein [Halovenus marina]|uniref:hypothetical protein n=1 Tax=Halovenus marina TaxID=3396621 RepID=UPI003F5726F3
MDNEEKPDWLTEMDEEILEVLGTSLILSPSIIAENIGRSREGVSSRLSALQAGGLVDKVDRGKYRLTKNGMRLVGWKVPSQSDAKKIGEVRDEIERRRRIKQELGVTLEEYKSQIKEEYNKIKSEENVDDPIEEAISRVTNRLQEEHSYFEHEKERLEEESLFEE